jgi:Ni,Fe-hydrogenase maturation factor
VAEALELARVLNRIPTSVLLYGIEGNQFDFGRSLSTEVQDAAEKVVAMVLTEVGSPAVQERTE